MSLYKNKLNPRTGAFNLVPSNQVVLFKAGVANFAALPLTGNEQNDARVVNDTHHLYVWSGTAWIDQGDLIDLTWAAIDGKPSSTPANIDDAVSKKHSQGTDQGLDTGGANASTAADVKDAVTKKHTQNTDTKLAEGTINEISASEVTKKLNAYVFYYVNPDTGDDLNPGTSGSPFKTINYALSKIPKNLNGTFAYIYLQDSLNYTEAITIAGFYGGMLALNSTTGNNLITAPINNSCITINYCSAIISLYKLSLKVQSSNRICVNNYFSTIRLQDCKVGSNGIATNTKGVLASGSGSIVTCINLTNLDANKVYYGVTAELGGIVNLVNNSDIGITNVTFNQNGIVTLPSSFLRTPSSVPTLDYEVANKYYVDHSLPFVVVKGFTDTDINNAITELGVGGGIIYLPVGTYVIDASIVIQADNTIIMGSGWGTSLDCSTLLAAEGQCFDLNGKVHTAFRDFEVVVGYTGQNIKVFHDGNVASPYLLLDNIYIQYPETYSVYAENTGSHSWVIQNCIIDMSAQLGVYLKGAFNRIINNEIFIYDYAPIICGSDTVITGNYLASGGNSILVLGDRCVITGNVMEYGDKSIILQTGGYATITGNTISGNAYGWGGGRHIEVSTSHNIITGNTFTDVQDTYYCVQLGAGASYNAILGNVTNGIDGTYQEGLVHIVGTGANYNIITGNNSKNSGTAAVVIDSGNSYNQVSWNNFEEETTQITDNGSDNTIVQAKTSNVSFGKDVNIAGELTIKVYTQDTEPTLDANHKMAIWIDSNDSYKVYLLFRRPTISGLNDQVKVELA